MIYQSPPLKRGAGHGTQVSGVGGGAAVGLLTPLACLGVIVAHGCLPSRVVAQAAVERIRKQGRVSRRVVNAHSAPRIQDLLGIADQRPTRTVGYALITGNVARAFNF